MVQLIVAMLMTISVVAFAMANSHHVEMGAVLGEPIRIRLFFLMSIFYVAGALTAFFYQLLARVSRRSRHIERSREDDLK
jgi:uncharacterized integral membrane protein